jgi:uncharacterized OB-fold protein
MSPDIENIPPVAEGIFSLPPYDDVPPVLLGGYCPQCKRYDFPRPKYCRKCLGHSEQVTLGREGEIYTYTIIRVKPPLGLPSPYAVGYIDLKESGLRIFCLLDPSAVDALQIGRPVTLKVAPLGNGVDGAPRLRPYFTPALQGSDGTEE